MIISGKVRVNACSFVLVGDESLIVAWSRVGGVCNCSQRACVVGNSMGCARIGACRCQVGLGRSEYMTCYVREPQCWEHQTLCTVQDSDTCLLCFPGALLTFS